MEYVITFKNTNAAIKAEQSLLQQGLHVGVMPLPSQISAGCGICLRISPDEIHVALETMEKNNIGELGLYSRVSEDGRYTYGKVDETCARNDETHARDDL